MYVLLCLILCLNVLLSFYIYEIALIVPLTLC